MKKFRIITSIVLSIALLAGSVSSFTIAPSASVFAKSKEQAESKEQTESKEQATGYTSINVYIDKFFDKELKVDSNKYPSDLEDIYNQAVDFITKNYSSLTKEKIQEEIDYLKGALRVFAILQLDKALGLQKLKKKIETFIGTVETVLAVHSYKENVEQLVDNFNVAKKESQRVFNVFKTQIKGKKVLELAEYFLSHKTQGAIIHHVLNIDGILFKDVDIDGFVPEQFATEKTKKITNKIKYVANIGITYNKMKKKKRNKTKNEIIVYINRPIVQIEKEVNTYMIKAEQTILNTYNDILATIKEKLKDFNLYKKEKVLDFQEEW